MMKSRYRPWFRPVIYVFRIADSPIIMAKIDPRDLLVHPYEC
jgi:hypothetical protein